MEFTIVNPKCDFARARAFFHRKKILKKPNSLEYHLEIGLGVQKPDFHFYNYNGGNTPPSTILGYLTALLKVAGRYSAATSSAAKKSSIYDNKVTTLTTG